MTRNLARESGEGETPPVPPTNDGAAFGAARRLRRAGLRYSRFVGMMKLILPLIAGMLVVMVVVWPEFSGEPSRFQLGVAEIDIKDADGQKLINARYTGADSKNNPYTVTADALAQTIEGGDLVDLKNPKADVTVAGGSWIALTAPTGQYSKLTQVLELTGGVNAFHDMGYEFRTERAIVDFHYGSAFGDAPVQGQGPFGSLKSEGFLILDGGASIVFTGRAKLVLYPGKEGLGR